MNPRGPGDQVNNTQGGSDFFGLMLTGSIIMFGIIALMGWIF
jgi:hypothetical protein